MGAIRRIAHGPTNLFQILSGPAFPRRFPGKEGKMDRALASLWAKSAKNSDPGWHPLILHMLNVATTVDAILAREPESTGIRMAEILRMEWEGARAWIMIVAACHDLGKACPGFQCKWTEMMGPKPS